MGWDVKEKEKQRSASKFVQDVFLHRFGGTFFGIMG